MTVDQALAELGRVTRLAPYAYATSWPLDEVEIVQRDGTKLQLLVKRLEAPDVQKPDFVVESEREIEAYGLLHGELLGTPTCHASGPSWLAIEKVEGVELWQRGDLDAWEAAARWARQLHDTFSGRALDAGHLLCHDEAFYRRWFERARRMAGGDTDALLPACDAAIERLTALPATLIHGELYASNVIVAGSRIAVVDWEMAALGPGVIDLAALVTGWGAPEQAKLVRAYGDIDPADVAAAQLQLALQWLGWEENWRPPREHRRDWLSEAQAAAEVLV